MSFFGTLEDTYEVFEEIGAGGGGKVYRAYHKRLEKEVVLKQIHKGMKNERNVRTEIDILKALKSKYLPQVFDILEWEGSVFTVMDYISGTSFEQLIRQGRRFSQGQIMRWAKELAEAAAYLHSCNPRILHTDIKPNNVMLTEEGSICLIDFHISSRSYGEEVRAIGYSEGYSPPEQYPYNGRIMSLSDTEDPNVPFTKTMLLHKAQYGNVDVRSDIYSIGATLYFILTGIKPESSWDEVTPIEQQRSGISPSLSHIIMKAMHPIAQKRYQTADELGRALHSIGRLNKRYGQFVLRQSMVLVGIMLLIGVSISIIIAGIYEIKEEKRQGFETAVTIAKAQVNGQNYDEIDGTLEQIHLYIEGEPESFCSVAMIFYEAEEYRMAVSFLEESLIRYPFLNNREGIDYFYFILADCYFMMEEFQIAAMYFERAISYEETNSKYYRDYAIALIRMGNETEALKILDQAEIYHVADSDLSMIRGELFFYAENYTQATEAFMNCLQHTDQDSIKMRAYLMAGKSYRAEERYREGIELLIDAKTKLPFTLCLPILELLAQLYIDVGSIDYDESAFLEAISILESMKIQGWSAYETDYTLTILYQQINELQRAASLLEEMQLLYGENYNIYKRLSFLEADLQSQKQITERDYKRFIEYYYKAVHFYETQTKDHRSDGEMHVLERLYEGLTAGGWND